MADEVRDERPDIFHNQREHAREKYASSDEEDEDHPPNPPEGPAKPPADDDEDDNNEGPRGYGRSGADGGSSSREQDSSSQAGSSAPFGALKPAVNGKRKAEDQNDVQSSSGEAGDDTDASTNALRYTEAESTITSTPQTSNMAPSTLAGEQHEGSSTENPSGEQPVASKLSFSFVNKETHTLAAEIHIMLLLGDCQSALRSRKTKAALGPYECNRLKQAALHAHSVAKGIEDVLAKKTMARCCVYIALTEALYSADSAQKSDQRALQWFRRSFAYRGTTEADLAQLWIKELEAHERARNAENHHILSGNSGGDTQDEPIALPDSPESPFSNTRRWLFARTPTSSS